MRKSIELRGMVNFDISINRKEREQKFKENKRVTEEQNKCYNKWLFYKNLREVIEK